MGEVVMRSSLSRPGPARSGAAWALGGALSLAAPACEVPHEYVTREFSAPATTGAPGLDAGASARGAMELVVRFSGGSLRLGAAEAGVLYSASVTHCGTHTTPVVKLDPEDGGRPGRLTIALEARPGVFLGFGEEWNLGTLRLAREIPQVLDLNLGTGESVIDLSGLRVRRLRLLAGAGDTRIVFGSPNREAAEEVLIEGSIGDISVDRLGNADTSRATIRGGVGGLEIDLSGGWRRDGSVALEPSVGDLHLRLPHGPGVRLRVGSPWDEGLRVPGFVRRGGALYSDGYEEAGRRVEVTVEAGLGTLSVEREGERSEEAGR